jgi:23S rRNA pseudouridine955/2504/2580 synthase
VPKGRLYRLLRKGEVRVNGGRVKAEYRLQPGDEVRIPPVRLEAPRSAPPDHVADGIADRIVFEDKKLLVIDKPSGVAVHGGSGVSFGVIELLRHARPEIHDLSLVHRLDRETSGVLVLAKRRSALRELHALFRDGVVEKNYLALAAGDWQLGDVVIRAPLLTTHRKNGERHVVVSEEGKPAETRIRLSRQLSHCSLIQCAPKTGRTHQIRVHALHAGHPLLGDERYGDAEQNARAKKLGLSRLFLHAQSISFPDGSGNERHFTTPLAEDLEAYLKKAGSIRQDPPVKHGRERRPGKPRGGSQGRR